MPQSFTHALYFLAANPQYLQPLRDEADAVVRREGWSKAALGHMRRVDSFLKETQRHTGLGCGASSPSNRGKCLPGSQCR